MKQKKKVKLKGFTLVELIVVIAVFGLLLAAALNLLQPVNNVFKSTATYTEGSAMIDNVSKYVEDNLRYSNRLWTFDSVSVLNEEMFVDKYTSEMVTEFQLDNPNKVSQKVTDEKIYVMKIDNPEISIADLEADTLAKAYLGSGKISLWIYDVAASSWIDASGSAVSAPVRNKESAVNPAFYNQYSYTTTIQEGYDPSNPASKDVSNIYLKLNLFYNEKPNDATHPLINTNLNNVVTFPLVNLVSNQSIIEEQIFTYKPGTTEVDKDNPTSVFRYRYNKGAVNLDGNTTDGVDIYFVFTKAPRIEKY